jgi:DNA gyrase subunit A
VALTQLAGVPAEAPIAGAVVLDRPFVVTASAAGFVKRTPRTEYEGRARAMVAAGVRPDDRIVAVTTCDEGDELLLAHDGGLVIRFPAADVRPTGRAATGVAGLQVPRRGRVVAFSALRGDAEVLTLAADGTAKRTSLAEYPLQGRGGKGVQTGTGQLAWCGLATDLHVPTAAGWTVLHADSPPTARRTAPGAQATDPVTGTVVPET